MIRLATLLLVVTLSIPGFAQVEIGKTKNTIMGKKKLIATTTDKMVVDNFSINLILYSFAEDQGGSNNVALSAKVGVRASLHEIDEALAQEIVDEAYNYFVGKWKERGVTAVSPTKEELEASKAYSKAMSKGKNANIINGGVWDNQEKNNHNMMAWPSDLYIANSGKGPTAKNGNFWHLMLDPKGNGFYTGFNTTINFIEFKTPKIGSTASVRSFPQLKAANSMAANFWQKNKVGGYIGSNSPEGTEDFYSDIKEEDMEALNIKVVMRNYIADKAKFKSNVLEMIKKGMDDMFADFDSVKSDAS